MSSETTAFTFSCPHCGQHLEAETDMVGMETECPICGDGIKVPAIQIVQGYEGALRENRNPDFVQCPLSEETGTPQSISLDEERQQPAKSICQSKKWWIVSCIGAASLMLIVGFCISFFGEKQTPEEQYKLGMKYYNGEGEEKDVAEAVKWYCKAAKHGYAAAQVALGLCYFNGEGVEKDYAEAMKWFRKAAEQGNAEAQCLLGFGYASGMGVSMDKREAIRWLIKAGEQGQVKAQSELAACYFLGRGVVQDYKESMKWCRKAAEQGDVESQYMLGGFYRSGLGVPVDRDEAAKWFRKAATQGFSRAQQALDALQDVKQQCKAEEETMEFVGQVVRIYDDCSFLLLCNNYCYLQCKVRLAGIKIWNKTWARQFLLGRYGGYEVRVTCKKSEWGRTQINGTIWAGVHLGGKEISENAVLVQEGYAEWDE